MAYKFESVKQVVDKNGLNQFGQYVDVPGQTRQANPAMGLPGGSPAPGQDVAYEQSQANLMRTAEKQKEVAQRALNQKYAGRLKAGAVAALGAKQESDINAGVQQQLGALSAQQAQQREGQAFQERMQVGQQQFLAGQQEKQIAEARRQYDQDYALSKQAAAINLINSVSAGDQKKLARIAEALGLTPAQTGVNFGNLRKL